MRERFTSWKGNTAVKTAGFTTGCCTRIKATFPPGLPLRASTERTANRARGQLRGSTGDGVHGRIFSAEDQRGECGAGTCGSAGDGDSVRLFLVPRKHRLGVGKGRSPDG